MGRKVYLPTFGLNVWYMYVNIPHMQLRISSFHGNLQVPKSSRSFRFHFSREKNVVPALSSLDEDEEMTRMVQ